jgi:hypothetical protein
MSTLPPKADIAQRYRHVGVVPKADIQRSFTAGNHTAMLWVASGHSQLLIAMSASLIGRLIA